MPSSSSKTKAKTPRLSRFRKLPRELKLLIWEHAVVQYPRIIKLDINLATVLTREPESKWEHVVFGGQLVARKAEGKELTSSYEDIQTLSRTCVDARDIVLREYPDVIRVQDVKQWKEKFPLEYESPRWDRHKSVRPDNGRYLRLRCNLRRDIFFFRRMSVGCALIDHNVDFARIVYNAYLFRGTREIKRMDAFRDALRSIKYLVLETTDPNIENDAETKRDLAVSSLLSATTGVKRLYVCPRGTKFRGHKHKTLVKTDLPNDAWKGMRWHDPYAETVPEDILDEFRDLRVTYTLLRYRYLAPACQTFNAVDIAAAGDAARRAYKNKKAGSWMEAFAALVGRLGFVGGIKEGWEVEERFRSERRRGEKGEVVWVPRPGYIVEV